MNGWEPGARLKSSPVGAPPLRPVAIIFFPFGEKMTFRVPNTTPSPVLGPEMVQRGATSPLSVRLKSQTPWIVVTAMRLFTGSTETRTGRSIFVLGDRKSVG